MKIIFIYVALLIFEFVNLNIGMKTRNEEDIMTVGDITHSEKESSGNERFGKMKGDSQIKVNTEPKNISENVKKRVERKIISEKVLKSNTIKVAANRKQESINKIENVNRNSTTLDKIKAIRSKSSSNFKDIKANSTDSEWKNPATDPDTSFNDTVNKMFTMSNKNDKGTKNLSIETDSLPIYINGSNVDVSASETKMDISRLFDKSMKLEKNISSLEEVVTNVNKDIFHFNNRLDVLEQKETYNNLNLRKGIVLLQEENFELSREIYLLKKKLFQIERRLEDLPTNYDVTLLNYYNKEQKADIKIIKKKIEYLEDQLRENSQINTKTLSVSSLLFLEVLMSLTYNNPHVSLKFDKFLQQIKDRYIWGVKNYLQQNAENLWGNVLPPPSPPSHYIVNSRFSKLNDENTNKHKLRTSSDKLFTTDFDKTHGRNNEYYKRSPTIQPAKKLPTRFNLNVFNPSASLNRRTKLGNIHQVQRPFAEDFLKYINNRKHIYESDTKHAKDYLKGILNGHGHLLKNNYQENNYYKGSIKHIYKTDPEYIEHYLKNILTGHPQKNNYQGNTFKDSKKYIYKNDPDYAKNYLKYMLSGKGYSNQNNYQQNEQNTNRLLEMYPIFGQHNLKDVTGQRDSYFEGYQENENRGNSHYLDDLNNNIYYKQQDGIGQYLKGLNKMAKKEIKTNIDKHDKLGKSIITPTKKPSIFNITILFPTYNNSYLFAYLSDNMLNLNKTLNDTKQNLKKETIHLNNKIDEEINVLKTKLNYLETNFQNTVINLKELILMKQTSKNGSENSFRENKQLQEKFTKINIQLENDKKDLNKLENDLSSTNINLENMVLALNGTVNYFTNMTKILKGKTSQLEDQSENFKTQLSTLQSIINNTTNNLTNHAEKASNISDFFKNYENFNNNLDNFQKNFESRLKVIETNSSQLNRNLHKLENDLNSTYINMYNRIYSLNGTINSISNMTEILKSHTSQLEDQNDNFKTQLSTLQNTINNTATDFTNRTDYLQSRDRYVLNKVTEMEENSQLINKEIQNNISLIQKDNNKFRERVSLIEQNLTSFDKMISKNISQLFEVNEVLNTNLDNFQSIFKSRLAIIETNSSQLNRELRKTNEDLLQLKEIQKENKILKDNLSIIKQNLTNIVDYVKLNISHLFKKNLNLNERLNSLQEILNKSITNLQVAFNENLTNFHANLNKKINILQVDVKTNLSQIDKEYKDAVLKIDVYFNNSAQTLKKQFSQYADYFNDKLLNLNKTLNATMKDSKNNTKYLNHKIDQGINVLETKLNYLETDLQNNTINLRYKIELVEVKTSKLQSESNNLNNEVKNGISRKVKKLEDTNEGIKTTIEDLHMKYDKLNNQSMEFKENNEKLSTLQQENKVIKGQVAALENNKNETIADFEKLVYALVGVNEELSEKIKKFENNLGETNVKEKFTLLDQKLTLLSNSNEKLEEENNILKSVVFELKKELDSINDFIKKSAKTRL